MILQRLCIIQLASIFLKHALLFDITVKADDTANNTKDTCPIMNMNVTVLCGSSYYIGIWNESGSNIFQDLNRDEKYYSGCYNPDECYLIQFNSWGRDCEYEINMDGEITHGDVAFDPTNKNQKIVFVGNCTNHVDKDQKLYVLTYQSWTSNVTYTFHRSGHSPKKSSIQAGNYEFFNMSESGCNIFTYHAVGLIRYFVVQNGETLESGRLLEDKTFGSCPTNICANETMLMLNNDMGSPFFYNLTTNGEILAGGYIEKNTTICFDSNNCNIITGNGTATYFFLKGTELYESGQNTDFYKIGACEKECDLMPVLSTTTRGKDIVTHLATISGMSALVDINAPQYKAACWIIYDDMREFNASSPNLVQRYVLGLFYIATNGPKWTRSYSFLSDKHECDWGGITCDESFVQLLSICK